MGNGYSCCGVQGFGQTRVQGTGFVGKGWEEGSSTVPLFRMDCDDGVVWYFLHLMECMYLNLLLYFFTIIV